MDKLRHAQRKVDNLCRIRTCHKICVPGVKFLVGAALHVFELIIKYDLQSILDVKNCQFQLQITTSDKLALEVSCELNAFRTG